MKIIIAAVLLLVAVPSHAAYFRVLGFGAPVQQSLSTLLDPFGLKDSAAVTDLALITHSTADGTIMPAFCQANWCPPESWSPLAIGAGADLKGNKVINVDTTVNLAPQLATLILNKVGAGSPSWLQVVKSGLAGTSAARVRIGWGELGYATRNGVFQSAKEAFPGAGALDILRQAGRVDIGVAWTY